MDSTYAGHVSRRFSDFLMASSFFIYSNDCSRSVLAKNWRLCMQLAANGNGNLMIKKENPLNKLKKHHWFIVRLAIFA
jgi:hypothetical protein